MSNLTSRQRILAYLDKFKGASAEEISLSLQVTPANIRYHLAKLVSDGRVEVLGSRPEQGRGRSVRIYASAKNLQDGQLAKLADVLLTYLMENASVTEADGLLADFAQRCMPTRTGETGLHITRRLAKTIEQLNQVGYDSRWEAHASGPRIIFEHCPFSAVITTHPELCRMDGQILEQHLGGTVEQRARLEKNARGTLYCQFILKGLS